ncbi:MAG: glycogen synthase GlgA [Pseudomonadota bacterium]
MNILFATSEIHPLSKTGGLADVSGALPAALRRLDMDVRVLIPGYSKVLAALPDKTLLTSLDLPVHGTFKLYSANMPDNTVPLIVIDHPAYFDRRGGPYQDISGQDWPDNYLRFGLLSAVAALLGSAASPLNWPVDIVHCNDWQTGLAPAYLHHSGVPSAASLMTIHNLAYQGIFPPHTLTELNLPPSSFSIEGLEYYGNLSFLKAGLYYADHISTVSPSYAAEIQRETLGFGLQGLLFQRRAQLTGIVNGIDTNDWNPASDPHLTHNYKIGDMSGKAAVKRQLQADHCLTQSKDTPLCGIISRMTHQKGQDLLLAIAPQLIEAGVQIIVLGSGDTLLETQLRQLATEYPAQISVVIGYDEGLAHCIEAGADIFLMPSRFEPCGLNQMYSQRYGTPPVVHRTGGLADTVIDTTLATLADGSATGFMFEEATPAAFLAAVQRALISYRNPRQWKQIKKHAMARDFSWEGSARHYQKLYENILTG